MPNTVKAALREMDIRSTKELVTFSCSGPFRHMAGDFPMRIAQIRTSDETVLVERLGRKAAAWRVAPTDVERWISDDEIGEPSTQGA